MLKESKAIEMPEGFEMVSDGTLTEGHDFLKDPIVQGIVKSIKTVMLKRGKRMEENRLIIVETTDDKCAVWESAGLKDLFDGIVVGDSVYIKYDGLLDAKDGLNPMKKFITGMSPTGDRSNASTE